jgi:hypothetical protein
MIPEKCASNKPDVFIPFFNLISREISVAPLCMSALDTVPSVFKLYMFKTSNVHFPNICRHQLIRI